MSEDRLLVIDDDAGFRNYVRRVGETAGFETLVTGDAKAFKEHVRSWHPSVIVMDLNMPDADGIELLRDLVEAKCKARIVIASGVETRILETAERLASERGLVIAGTLQKPVRANSLRETLERLHEFEKPLIAGALAYAIAHDGLFLEYQPKLDCKSGRIFGVEALVRWQHPSRGIIPPEQFLKLAEQSGVIHALTEWVATAAARQVAAWRRAGMPLEIAINVSARDLAAIEFPDAIMAICQTAGLAADAVTLEMTESAAMGDPAQALDVLTRLRLKGFRLSIDNFGTGYSSLLQLRRLPLSELKIDTSFVTQMHRNQDCRVIVEAVISLAHKLGLAVVAEGVESAENLAALVDMGADAAQGFFLGGPARGESVAALIKRPTDALAPHQAAEAIASHAPARRSRARRTE
ncbi:MAG TPA: EAL domain-containing response regulator [Stellaceae bacterium]|nr:EAL domain-containing response regulator [Stellaceae bacterium]